jgi:LacI family transcriptional regulator
MPRTIRIGLVFSHGLAYCRGALRGVKQYARAKQDWTLLLVAPEPRAVRSLGRLDVAGLIVHVYTAACAAAVAALGRPFVSVSGVLPDLAGPRIGPDDDAVGRLAAEHLLDRGLRNFAFVGHDNRGYAIRREAGFRRALAARGHAPHGYLERDSVQFNPMGYLWALDVAVQRWVQRLPKPVGIFASTDIWGVQLAEVCRQTGLRVPEDVALVGVDNDDLLCEVARPSLSSIALPTERIGFEAAALLDRILARERPSLRPRLLPPIGVVARQSSDVLALDDPEVAAAVRFIREHSHTSIGVKDVLRAVTISRRSLERRFQAALDRTVWEEIRRAHLERAKSLLAGTAMPMWAVAEQAGFSDPRQLSVVFRQETGLTPTAYRGRVRG